MKNPVSFSLWLYHTTFHKARLYSDLGEATGRIRRYCSCGISWSENNVKHHGEKALAALLILLGIIGGVLLALAFGRD